MQALVKPHRGPGLALRDVAIPQPRSTEVLVEVLASAICGSDLPIYDWDDPWTRRTVRPGQVIGHEFAGTVVACGSEVEDIPIGALATAEGHLNCTRCPRCLDGQGHVCPHMALLGFDAPGAFADYVAVPARNIVSLTGLDVDVAAIQDPFGNAVHAVSRVPLGDSTVLVSGCGPVGLMVISLAAASGARTIIASDFSSYRRDLARAMGASLVVDPGAEHIGPAVARVCHPESGPDVFFEMSGTAGGLQEGFSAVRPGGSAVLLGLAKTPIPLDFAEDLIGKGLTVFGVVGRLIFETWTLSRRYMSDTGSDIPAALARLITHRLRLSEYVEAFDLARSRECGKVLLVPDRIADRAEPR